MKYGRLCGDVDLKEMGQSDAELMPYFLFALGVRKWKAGGDRRGERRQLYYCTLMYTDLQIHMRNTVGVAIKTAGTGSGKSGSSRV